jgi:glycosyltransferase involved in cell wall biosynthesis
MNIILIHDAPLYEWKGTQKALLELGNYLVERGHNVTFLNNVSFRRNAAEKLLSTSRIPLFSIVNFPFRRFLGMWFISKKNLQKYQPDVIYISSLQSFFYIPFYGINTILSTFVIGPEHEKVGTKMNRTVFRIKKSIYRLITFLYRSDNTLFHTLNPSQKKWLQKNVATKHTIYMIPPPLDCKLYRREDDYKMNLDTFNVTYLGPLTRYKGFNDFIEIVHSINKILEGRRDKLIFIIVGGGELMDSALNLEKMYTNVRYLGTLSENENLNVYRKSHLLVSPSYVENFHYVTAEAQLFGIPVISSNISGPRSIIESNITGKLVNVGQIDDFVLAILEYYRQFINDSSEYLGTMRQISHSAEKFCKEKVLPLYEDMFLSIVKKNGQFETGFNGEK